MSSFLISVIVPCYNVEKYIDRCLETLVNQTISINNLEIILVNDASTDSTIELLQKWESLYPDNIIVVSYEENLRQGGARNVGLQYATADYIGFVDADDWVELDMFEALYEPIKRERYDSVRGKFIREKYKGEIEIDSTERKDQKYHFEKVGDFYRHNVIDHGNAGEYGGIWSAIYSKKIILDNEIWFPEKIAYEDNYWGGIINLYLKDLYIVDKIIYHYFINMESTVTLRNAEHQFDRLDIEIGIVQEYQRRGAYSFFEQELEWGFIKRFYLNTLYIIFTRFDFIPDIFHFLKDTLLELFPDYKRNPMLSSALPREKQLLRLLDIQGDVTVDDLSRIKKLYTV